MLVPSGARRPPRHTGPAVVHIAPVALDLVASLEAAPGQVHSVFAGALNVVAPGGLLTLVSPASGRLPAGIGLAISDLRTLRALSGMAVTGRDTLLIVSDADLEIDVAGAAIWAPRLRPVADGATRALGRWRRRRAGAWRTARSLDTRGGLAPLLCAVPGTSSNLWERRASTGLAAMTDAVERRDRPAATDAARDLIGLGPGATPSADDALVGVEAVLHALDDPLAGFLGDALEDVDARTTVVSAAQLRHAARGDVAELVHGLMAALLGPADVPIGPAISRTTAWGATSGVDGLVGVLLALDAVGARSLARTRSA